MTLQPGANLNTNGYRLVVSGTLTLGDGSHIHRDGVNGNQGFGGAALDSGSLGGAGRGSANACGPAAGSTTNSLGGNGGASVFCGGGGTATRPADPVGGARAFEGAVAALSGRTLDGAPVWGGAGGDSAGGGVAVVISTSAQPAGVTLSANGGTGAGAGLVGFARWFN